MRNPFPKTWFKITVFLWTVLSVVLLIPSEGLCQSDPSRFEVGGQYVFVNYPEFDQSDHGIGGRFTYNINRYLALEGELNLFPQKKPVLNSVHLFIQDYVNSRRMEGLFGVKAGIRRQRMGLFGKVRPGKQSYSHSNSNQIKV